MLSKIELVSTPDSSKVMSDFILYDHTVEIGLTCYELRYTLSENKENAAYIFREHIRVYCRPVLSIVKSKLEF